MTTALALRVLAGATFAVAVSLALGGVARASGMDEPDCEEHWACDGAYLAVLAVAGGALALGSSALGTGVTREVAAKQGAPHAADGADSARPDDRQVDAVSAQVAAPPQLAPAQPVPPQPAPPPHVPPPAHVPAPPHVLEHPVGHGGPVDPMPHAGHLEPHDAIKAGGDYAAKLAKEMAPHGDAAQSGIKIVEKTLAGPDRMSGLGEGLGDVAAERLKDAVNEGMKNEPATPLPAATIGATVRYCPNCGAPRREGARFCGKCGTKLG